jgi:radical SAM family uncharacterized protein/radical SAM-linked protein
MAYPDPQAILAELERPSRYLGGEIHRILKDPTKVALRIALAFPDLYDIGTSHFGLQILYHILNAQEQIAAERVFAPAADLEAALRRHGAPLVSLESRTPLHEFDIIGFSLLYELSYTNIVTMLDLAGVPLRAAQRRPHQPLIIAGGPCTVNPEPLAEVFDAMVIGDGEAVVLAMSAAWLAWRREGAGRRDELLRAWSRIEGVYVPSLFTTWRDADGHQRLEALDPGHGRVRRAVVANLEQAPFPTRPVIPFGRPVHDRLRLEIARGCSRGCRFCQAGMIYRPVRERRPRRLLELAEEALSCTGYEDLSLLSLSSGDYSQIGPLMAELARRLAPRHVALSLPSLRAGTLTPELMRAIQQVRKTGFTIAPEAGSQRLRDVINKNITVEQIITTVEHAFNHGWQLIKLYFMVGLPTERDADLEALVALVQELRRVVRRSARGRRGQITVSVGTFVPKAHTPFQWCGQLTRAESQRRIGWLREALNLPAVAFKWQKPTVSWLEGLWARGDRRLLPLLLEAWHGGARLDGWSDHFRWPAWEQALEKSGIDASRIVERERQLEEPLPWDHIESGVSRQFLEAEYRRALAAERTDDCRDGVCQGCGVCDFKQLEPRLCLQEALDAPDTAPPDNSQRTWLPCRLHFQKIGPARFFGHLEMSDIFVRALRRAAIPVRYSEGFHPKPRLSFGDALPVGMESLCEQVHLQLPAGVSAPELRTALNAQLPEGLEILDVFLGVGRQSSDVVSRYRVSNPEGAWDPARVSAFRRASSLPWQRARRQAGSNAQQLIDLKAWVLQLDLEQEATLHIELCTAGGVRLRPAEALGMIFDLKPDTVRRLRVVKLDERPLPSRRGPEADQREQEPSDV